MSQGRGDAQQPGDPVRLITTAEGVAELAAEVAASDVVAVDTEFVREKTYYGRLCLVQIATDTGIACVDAIAIDALGDEAEVAQAWVPLLAALYDPGTLKLFHAADQDLLLFYERWGSVPAPVLDTQLAASVLGYGEQVGYANLVDQVLGVRLDKGATRTDWSRRPLSERQLRYAAADVDHLLPMGRTLMAQLDDRGRRDWIARDLEALVQPERYRTRPEEAWRRVKGGKRLKGERFYAMVRLAEWRERRAQAADRPRGWVLKDQDLMGLVTVGPRDLHQMGRIQGIPRGLIERQGETLLALLDPAAPTPDVEPPARERGRRAPVPDGLVELLGAVVRATAAAHDVSAASLANRKALERIAGGAPPSEVLTGWRLALVGPALGAVLDGTMALGWRDGALALHELSAPG